MPAWPSIVDGAKTYDLTHLDPFAVDVPLRDGDAVLRVEFSSHVFSNEAGRGVRIPFVREERYFCPIRYRDSFEAAAFMRTGFVEAHVRAFLDKKSKEQFYTTDAGALAIFMSIHRSVDAENELKCRVVSAYEPTWGRTTLPRGQLYAVRTVLTRRLDGLPIPAK